MSMHFPLMRIVPSGSMAQFCPALPLQSPITIFVPFALESLLSSTHLVLLYPDTIGPVRCVGRVGQVVAQAEPDPAGRRRDAEHDQAGLGVKPSTCGTTASSPVGELIRSRCWSGEAFVADSFHHGTGREDMGAGGGQPAHPRQVKGLGGGGDATQ